MMTNKQTKVKSSQILTEEPSNLIANISLFFIALYLLIDCVPFIQIQDQMGLHWLLLAILNGLASVFIFRSTAFDVKFTPLFKNAIPILYLCFIILSGLSIFVALNKVESLINYCRLLTVAASFFIICTLLYKRKQLLKDIGFVVTLIVLAQSFSAVMQFYSGIGKVGLDILTNSLQSSTGNKNIFAAALVIKIPIIIYCIVARDGFIKYLSALALTLALVTVLFINARAAYLGLGLSLLIIAIGFAYIQIKTKLIKQFSLNAILICTAYLLAFFISQNAIRKALKFSETSIYGSVGDRLSTIVDTQNQSTSIRLDYWKKAADFIAEKPLLGLGYGNWKLNSTRYTNVLLDDNVFSKHPHNDFIEIAGESGIPNSFIYLSIFVLALIFTIKILIFENSLEKKLVALFVFASLSGYFVDAFFNFPSERPNMQLLFALLLALIVTNYLSNVNEVEKPSGTKVYKVISLVGIVLSGIVVYVHYTALSSMQSQFIVDNDLNSVDNSDALPKLKFSEVNTMFPSFPNIAENSETIGYKKAKYLQKEKRYDEAIKLLDSVHYQSPNLIYDIYLKCNIYKEAGNIDSAYKYGKQAFYAKPRHFYYYRMASYFAGLKKDTSEVKAMFKTYNTYRKDQQSYSYYAQSLKLAGYNNQTLERIVADGLKLYPKDQELINLSHAFAK